MARNPNRTEGGKPASSSPGRRAATQDPQADAPIPVAAAAPRDDGQNNVGLRVRMYRVGFGDFFLLSVPTSEGQKHILIDCGVHHSDLHTIDGAIAQMAQDCGDKLALIIMTHRHADHISGFARCADIFKRISVEHVWMPWFEDPKNKDAVNAQAGLTAVAEQLHKDLASPALAAADGEDLQQYRFMAANVTGGAGAGSNKQALDLLKSGFADGETKHFFYKAGHTGDLPDPLSKVLTAEILGPPDDLKLIAQMRKASEEYLTDDEKEEDAPFAPFHPIFQVKPEAYDPEAFKYMSVETIQSRFLEFQVDALGASAKNVDDYLNNQSLIVLFRFKGKSLLFVGDAQWGNWQNFLYGGQYGTDGHTTMRPEAREILSNIDFYKVGHHGSANATPKDAVLMLRHGCVGMCSTQTPAYNEVPREPLLDALRAQMNNHLARSDQIKAGNAPPNPTVGQLDKMFKTPIGELFIDYYL